MSDSFDFNNNGFIAKKRQELAEMTLIDIMSYVFPFVSAFATYTGMKKLMNNGFELVGAIVAFLFVAAFYRSYLKWFPAANARSRSMLVGPMILFGIFAICLTTPFSAATFGGDIALRKDFEKTIAMADDHGRTRLGALESEQSLAGSLGQSSTEFLDLSKQEAGGAFTGVTGRGNAAITFETVGQQLGRMQQLVVANKTVIDGLKAEDAQLMTDLRNITYEHTSQQEKVANFATKLNQLKDLFTRMDAASVVPTVAQAAGSLNMVAQLQTADAGTPLAAKQSVTIGKAQDLVMSVQRDIDKAAANLKASATPMSPLVVIDESEAIVKYAGSIAWAWALALTLDFAPLMFLYMLSVFNDINRPKKRSSRKPDSAANGTSISRIGGQR